MKHLTSFLSSTVLIGIAVQAGQSGYTPPKGFVPDAPTAIAIAVAVWNPIYGKPVIASEKPYTATLNKGVWTVEGSLPKGATIGGTAIARIAKLDGRILFVSHGK